MYEELEYEISQLVHDLEEGSLTFGRYFDEDDYEDEYSHNMIDEFQEKFVEKATEYLHENHPGKYIISDGWCVFVMTIEEAKKRNMKYIDDLIIY